MVRSPFLLTCDHYGRLIPKALGDLGLPESELTRHIGWDIGIAGVAEQLSKDLDAHLIVQRYSRLVIDCNRPPHVENFDPADQRGDDRTGDEAWREAKEVRRAEIFCSVNRLRASKHGIALAASCENQLERCDLAARVWSGI